MSKGLNKVMLIGYLGKDPETRFTSGGAAVTNFSLATSRRVKKDGEWTDETEWHDVVMWKGEKLAEYMSKGTQVYIEGRLQTRSWEAQDGSKKYRTEVVCDSYGVMLLGNRSGSDDSERQRKREQPAYMNPEVDDSDVPF